MDKVMRYKTTKQHSKWWQDRKIDWKTSYTDTWNHPHRDMISYLLGKIRWYSLMEVGCGSGPNLLNILKKYPGKQLGGIDINPDAVKLAQETFAGGFFKVGSADDIMMSDNSMDVVLTDMTLIYIGPRKINKVIKELKRVSRHYVVLCELHSDSIFDRIRLRLGSGYNAYNYEKLLKKHGFNDITLIKIPPEVWDGKPQKPYGFIILARVPKNYD